MYAYINYADHMVALSHFFFSLFYISGATENAYQGYTYRKGMK